MSWVNERQLKLEDDYWYTALLFKKKRQVHVPLNPIKGGTNEGTPSSNLYALPAR